MELQEDSMSKLFELSHEKTRFLHMHKQITTRFLHMHKQVTTRFLHMHKQDTKAQNICAVTA